MKKEIHERTIIGTLIIILIALTVCLMINVRNLQGNARVVNYAGIIRGATQRMVKLEIVEQTEKGDFLIQYLDEIFYGLLHGGGRYQLTHLTDKDYNEKLDRLYEYWDRLKAELDKVRENGYENTNIIDMSEEYFALADETVDAAEICSQRYATKLDQIEKVLTLVILLIIIMLIKQSAEQVILAKNNSELQKKAYIDLHTGLPNKSRCEELLLKRDNLGQGTAVVIFDVNGLKDVNDILGHLAGDTLILNFARILRNSIPQEHFVGRYGGDEFIAVLTGVTQLQTEKILEQVQKSTDEFNAYSKQLHLEYAQGYAISDCYKECNLKILLDQADQNMYRRKSYMKEHTMTSSAKEEKDSDE